MTADRTTAALACVRRGLTRSQIDSASRALAGVYLASASRMKIWPHLCARPHPQETLARARQRRSPHSSHKAAKCGHALVALVEGGQQLVEELRVLGNNVLARLVVDVGERGHGVRDDLRASS